MRERITIAFVVLAMAVLLGAGAVRAYTCATCCGSRRAPTSATTSS